MSAATFNFYEFFCGGGMAREGLGPQWACTFANDNDAGKARSYAANFGHDELKVGDVASLTTRDLLGRADLAWMSAPCVGHSEAGDRRGFDEKQSGAFWPAWRLIEGLAAEGRAPPVIAFENVPGLLEPHSRQNLAAIHAAFTRTGYRHAPRVIDARHFVPQSRPRLFIVASLTADPEPYFERAMQALPERNIDLADILDLDAKNCSWEFSPAEVARHLAMMTPEQQARVEKARMSDRPIAGPFARRMRGPKGARIQRVEARFDGVANALRVAGSGGSSKQFVMIVRGVETRMRAIQPREAAHLMGLSESYVLPANPVEALSLCGDGVVVPVVRFLAEHIPEPLLAPHIQKAGE